MPKVESGDHNYNESDSLEAATMDEGVMAHMKRMQNSAFWLFLWNNVYDKDETEAKARQAAEAARIEADILAREKAMQEEQEAGNRTRGARAQTVVATPAPKVVVAPILDNEVTRTMMTNFETIKIVLMSLEDCEEDEEGNCEYDNTLIFQNGMPTAWTVARCKTFQDVLTLDCIKNKRVSKPVVLPVQHLVLQLPENFRPGQYTIGVVGCNDALGKTTGMYFTARDVDAEHVFEADVLDHNGADWMWDKMGALGKTADVHGFHQLYNGKFLCEEEPGKYTDPRAGLDEYGRRTIWIGLPIGKAGSQDNWSTDLIGGFGGSVPSGQACYRYTKERVAPGYIAAIGLELQTHDNLGVMVFTDDQCSVCLETPADLVMRSVGACNHRALCSECANMLNQKLLPCPICRAPNVLVSRASTKR